MKMLNRYIVCFQEVKNKKTEYPVKSYYLKLVIIFLVNVLYIILL